MPADMSPLQKHLRNTFLTGVFAAIPLAVTVFVVWYVESKTRQPLRDLLRINIPFLGVVVALVLIYLLGLAVGSIIGKWILSLIDKLLLRVPMVKDLYLAWKHISVTPGGREGIFAKVVLVPVENDRTHTLGFSSGEPLEGDANTTAVFIPAVPNPMNGRLHFVPIADVIVLGVSPEEAFKMILSGGNYVPAEVGAATAAVKRLDSFAPTTRRIQSSHPPAPA
jgi:uncharacterized membrane protein